MVGSAFCHSKVDQKSTKNSLRLGEKLAVSSQWLCNFDTLKGAKVVDLCVFIFTEHGKNSLVYAFLNN